MRLSGSTLISTFPFVMPAPVAGIHEFFVDARDSAFGRPGHDATMKLLQPKIIMH